MEVRCLVLRNIFPYLTKPALLLAFAALFLLSAINSNAQQASAPPESKTDATSDLKTSLNSLSSLYQKEVQRLEKQQQSAKELFDQGLISRLELEKGDKELADARSKVDQVANEIVAANQPAIPLAPIGGELTAMGNAVWST